MNADQAELTFVGAFQRLVGEIFRLNGQLLATADRLSGDLDISTARWQVIAVIREQPLTVAEISRRLGIRRQSVQPTVNRLRDQGLVRFRPNPRHARSPLAGLTRKGQSVMRELSRRQIRLTGRFTRELGFSVEEIESLTATLRRMREQARSIDAAEIIRGSRRDE